MSASRLGLYAWLLLWAACAADLERPEELGGAAPPAVDSVEIDLLQGPMPGVLSDARDQQEQGRTFELDTMRALHDYGVANEHDPRPWLLLGYDAMRADLRPFAVRYYGRAIDADPQAAAQKHVLEDLLSVVRDYNGVEREEASAIVLGSYDRAALYAVDDAVQDALDAGDNVGVKRLRLLQVQLEAVLK